MEICRRWGRVIRNWLTQRGVQAVRLSIEPFGETRPAFDNADEWGRRLNRRILFRAKLPGGAQ
jgi:outer membrane protein OmpA-like peptidoglycan-associated protein